MRYNKYGADDSYARMTTGPNLFETAGSARPLPLLVTSIIRSTRARPFGILSRMARFDSRTVAAFWARAQPNVCYSERNSIDLQGRVRLGQPIPDRW